MIDKLAKQLFNDISDALSGQHDALSSSKLKSLIESSLRRLNLVTRDEFDAQQAVLLRTREKLEALEKQLQVLETEIGKSANKPPE